MNAPPHGEGAAPSKDRADNATPKENDSQSSAEIAPTEELAAPAGTALHTGNPVTLPRQGLILVPDTLAAEMAANGSPVPSDSLVLRREDGRSVYAFRLPGVLR